jgi:uncharacterized protein (UPF0335 family)
MVTPFVGAALLRSILRLVSGVDSISWFSTTLFGLAAGVRPWGHLISRLRERTASLHDAIHYPSPDTQFIAASRLQGVVDRVNSLEQELSTIKRAMAMRAYVEEIHDDLSSALQDTERAMRKQERKSESLRLSYDTRLATVEKAISRIERARGERPRGIAPSSSNVATSAAGDRAYSRVAFILASIFRLLRAIANSLTFNYFDPPSSPTTPSIALAPVGARPPLHHAKPPSRLETIEEDETEPLVAVRHDENPRSSGYADSGIQPMFRHSAAGADEKSRLQRPRSLVSTVANVVSLPYRLAVGILVSISPPLERVFN